MKNQLGIENSELPNRDSDAADRLGITDWDCGEDEFTPEDIAAECRDSACCLHCAIDNLGGNPLDYSQDRCECEADDSEGNQILIDAYERFL